jgi:ABC-2 type transport system permease protein
MNTQSNAPDSPQTSPAITPASLPAARLFYWSVRRELWEYRSIYLAPLAGAGIVLCAFVFVLAILPHTMRKLSWLDPAQQHKALAHPYDIASALIMGAAFIVSIFYSLDALYGERRDRSILFWKSLPVSDLTAVLAKASVPLVILPLLSFAIAFVTESLMLLVSSMVLLAGGLSVATLWTEVQLYQTLLGLLYHLVTIHMLWYAPLYAWLLLVSAWARRTPFLWAVLPPLGIGFFEKIAFRSSHFADLLLHRVGGGSEAGDSMQGGFPTDPGMHLALWNFLSSPGLWFGLLAAAIFLAAAVRMRRYRDPI